MTPSAPVTRRLACLVYELCLLFGFVFLVGYTMLAIAQWRWPLGEPRLSAFRAIVFASIGVYFGYFWTRSGQTLAMKTWRIRLVDAAGDRVTWPHALLRYLAAWWPLLPSGVVRLVAPDRPLLAFGVFLAAWAGSYLWAPFDSDRQFLADRLAGTRIVAA